MFRSIVCLTLSVAVTQAAISALTSSSDQQALLKIHNDVRQAENAQVMPDLIYDDDLAKLAQTWTDKCQYAHQNHRTWGENLAVTTYPQATNLDAINKLVGLWLAEAKYVVNGSYTGCCSQQSHSCCHLTQVLWAKTTSVGCGLTLCKDLQSGSRVMHNAAYLACYYSPAGNKPITHCEQDWRPYIPA